MLRSILVFKLGCINARLVYNFCFLASGALSPTQTELCITQPVCSTVRSRPRFDSGVSKGASGSSPSVMYRPVPYHLRLRLRLRPSNPPVTPPSPVTAYEPRRPMDAWDVPGCAYGRRGT
ncbi:hypothetical protein BV22DRAFT_725266 [Leucogyrophana mollusca]|uniref:Uncharacterized protein n=1 Tax=Leucogyrophana mollusca TaxID=85980 RepID=A0ACB8B8K5_9AGAM|nr:hypothetical protein BV22DRAFT_725266 [Leucogyrophana mollusca]